MSTDFASVTKKLGFGLMRLPKEADDPSKIDIPQFCEMVDLFMDAGFTYFDTAYVYDNGASEEATKKALVERYPRDSYTLATKMNSWLGSPDEESTKKQLDISLERTGAGYFDFYLLHALQLSNGKIYEDYGLWDYVREAKAQGKIKHWGFSFHGTPDMLEEFLTKYDDAEFVQLQINYADWEFPVIAARQCYEIARAHDKQIVVMEPVRGGTLATPPKAIEEIFKKAAPDASCASWAIRFAASLPGIITVLSGMSDVEQMKDNISYMKDFRPLDEKERAVIDEARAVLDGIDTIGCTSCHYCVDGCPQNILIPGMMHALNIMRLYDNMEQGKRRHFMTVRGRGLAGDCIACGQCEGACPQHLPIIEHLREAAALFEAG